MDMKRLYRGSQAGKSRLGLLFFLLIVAVLIYAGSKIVPVYFMNYQIQDLFNVAAFRVSNTPLNSIRDDMATKLAAMDAPISINDVHIWQNDQGNIVISARYSVTVKLVDDYYKITLNFHPKANSHAKENI